MNTNIAVPLCVADSGPTDTIITIRVGTAPLFKAFHLPKRQLCFHSPYLRTLIERAARLLSPAIHLSDMDPGAFQVLSEWMNYSPAVSSHQKGAALVQKIAVEGRDGVALAFKLWILAHRLGGSCLVLRV
jgi:hypothetical protein